MTNEVKILIEGYSGFKKPGRSKAWCTITLIKSKLNIIVDTGIPSQKDVIIEKLKENNLSPDDIHFVVLTHGQSDHIGNNNLFPKAKFILDTDVSQGEEYSVHNFDEDAFHICEGVYVIPTPGHTDHDLSVVVETIKGTVVVAGDIFEKKDDWIDVTSWQAWSKNTHMQSKSREKILRIADYIVPGHGNIFKVPDELSLRLPTTQRKHSTGQEPYLERKEHIISELAERFKTHWSRIDEYKIRDFLKQFGGALNMGCILPLLQKIEYIDDGVITDVFNEFYNSLSNKTRKQIVFSGVGSLKDSSSLFGYICSKIFNEKQRRDIAFDSLEQLAKKYSAKETVLVFVDDMIGTGDQAVRIFSEWLGISKSKTEHVNVLSDVIISWLKEVEIKFFCMVAFKEGILQVNELAIQQGIDITIEPSIIQDLSKGCFNANSLIFENPQVRLQSKKLCAEIGFQLFSDRRDWSIDKRNIMSLGYKSGQKLIVFSYNTPNCTLPIFWKHGEFNGSEWVPLFPRRD